MSQIVCAIDVWNGISSLNVRKKGAILFSTIILASLGGFLEFLYHWKRCRAASLAEESRLYYGCCLVKIRLNFFTS